MRHLKTSTLHIFEQDAFYTGMDQNLENITSEKWGHKYPYIISAAGCHSKYSDLLGNYFWDGKNISNSLNISRFLQNSSGYSS